MTRTLTHARVQHRLLREEGVNAREQRSGTAKAHDTHTSVMLKEAVEMLAIGKKDIVVDATAGLGGHSEALLSKGAAKVISLDADPAAVAATAARLKHFKKHSEVVEANFADIEKALKSVGVKEVNKVLFDLGWNMTQLGSGRGFSFLQDEPLNMSFGKRPRSGLTAAEMLNSLSEEALADIFFGYGEERFARRIARAVVDRREDKPFETTIEFVEVLRDSVPAAYRRGRLHPATRSFQGLRIAVNDELGAIEAGIAAAWKHLARGGRIAVITFHSIEDRVVKKAFAALVKEKEGKLLVKKPLVPSIHERAVNPSARSAKLRGIEKI